MGTGDLQVQQLEERMNVSAEREASMLERLNESVCLTFLL